MEKITHTDLTEEEMLEEFSKMFSRTFVSWRNCTVTRAGFSSKELRLETKDPTDYFSLSRYGNDGLKEIYEKTFGKPATKPNPTAPSEEKYHTFDGRTFYILSCRFEGSLDYTNFIVAAHKAGVDIYTNTFVQDKTLPDVEVEFSAMADYSTILKIMMSVTDLHVGYQTLRSCRLKDNTLERDWSL